MELKDVTTKSIHELILTQLNAKGLQKLLSSQQSLVNKAEELQPKILSIQKELEGFGNDLFELEVLDSDKEQKLKAAKSLKSKMDRLTEEKGLLDSQLSELENNKRALQDEISGLLANQLAECKYFVREHLVDKLIEASIIPQNWTKAVSMIFDGDVPGFLNMVDSEVREMAFLNEKPTDLQVV